MGKMSNFIIWPRFPVANLMYGHFLPGHILSLQFLIWPLFPLDSRPLASAHATGPFVSHAARWIF